MNKSFENLETAFKLHTILMITILIVSLLIMGNCYSVFAETTATHGFYGLENIFKDPDSIVKLYKSGGFSLKNYDMGLAIYAHPVENTDMYKFLVMESNGKVSRFLIGMETISNESIIVEKTIEPKSSIGRDLSKWNVPTHNPRDEAKSMLITIKGDTIQSLNLGDDYEKTFRISASRTNAKLVGVDVVLEIIRDDFIYKSVSVKTLTGGIASFEIKDLDYPLFYPKFCYDIIITATIGNATATWRDDFTMIHSGVWNPNFNWIGEQRWNYLPKSFEFEPRQLINADEKCN